MIRVCQVQLGEALGTAKAVEQLANQKQRVPIQLLRPW